MNRKNATALLVLLAVLVFSVAATNVTTQKFAKQSGGSTGDSVIVGADTSTAYVLPNDLAGWWVAASNDSDTTYLVQATVDGNYWTTVDFDTVSEGTSEVSTDFGTTYNTWSVRVIQDNLKAAGGDYGAVYLFKKK